MKKQHGVSMKVLGSRVRKVCSWILFLQHSNCLSFCKPPCSLVSSSRTRGLIIVEPYRAVVRIEQDRARQVLDATSGTCKPSAEASSSWFLLAQTKNMTSFLLSIPASPTNDIWLPLAAGYLADQLEKLESKVMSPKASWEVAWIQTDTDCRVSVFWNSWLLNVISTELILSIGDGRIMPQHVSSFISTCSLGIRSVDLTVVYNYGGCGVVICVSKRSCRVSSY